MRKGINFRFFHTIIGKGDPAKHEALLEVKTPLPATRGGHRWGLQVVDGEKPLSDCREGELLFIRRIVGRGPIHKRLLEMGLTPGAQIRIVKYAPLKDPLECEVKGYHVALRVAEAQTIIVSARKS